MQGVRDSDIKQHEMRLGSAPRFKPPRIDTPELLDQGMGTDADVRANLLEMARLNRLFGGVRSLTMHLYPRLRNAGQPVRVLDIGTGSGDIALTVKRWARENRLDVTLYPLDISARNLKVTQEVARGIGGMRLLQADALALPFAENGFDYAISSLMLHHLTPEQLIMLIRETYRKARRGIVFTDLVRGTLPLAAFDLFVSPFFAKHYLTRYDGRVSIQRAYTPDELKGMAREAGVESAKVYAHFPFRMTVVADKPDV